MGHMGALNSEQWVQEAHAVSLQGITDGLVLCLV